MKPKNQMRTRGDENLNTLCKHNKNLRRVIDDFSKFFFFFFKRRPKLNCLFNDGESRPLSSPSVSDLKCPCVNFIFLFSPEFTRFIQIEFFFLRTSLRYVLIHTQIKIKKQ